MKLTKVDRGSIDARFLQPLRQKFGTAEKSRACLVRRPPYLDITNQCDPIDKVGPIRLHGEWSDRIRTGSG